MAIIYLDRSLPAGSPENREATYPLDERLLPPASGPDFQLTWSCRRRGLPCRCSHLHRGALLPHHFTIAWALRGAVGCIFSVALSRGSPRVVISHRRCPALLGLSSLLRIKLCRTIAQPTQLYYTKQKYLLKRNKY
jgi:hypothetical protein